MISRMKQLVLVSLLISIATLTTFHDFFLAKFVEFSLRNYCKEHLSTILKEDKVHFKEHLIVFENPQLLESKDFDKSHLIADELLVYYEPNLLKGEVDLHITINNPKIDVALMASSLKTHFENNVSSFDLFTINHSIEIKNGILRYPKEQVIGEATFSSRLNSIEKKDFRFTLNKSSEKDDEGLDLYLFQNESGDLVMDLSLNDLCCKMMSQLLKAMIEGFDQIEVLDGKLNGKARIAFQDNSKWQTVSDITAKDLSFIYKPLKIYGEVPFTEFHFTKKNRGRIDFKEASLSFRPTRLKVFEYNQLMGNCSIDFNLDDPEHIMQVNFRGGAEHLVSFFGDPQKIICENTFSQDDLSLKGRLKQLIDSSTLEEFYSFDGVFNVFSKESKEDETFLFGFELEKKKEKGEKIALQNGWFRAFHLNLEKYLTPFLFEDNQMKLSGFGDFYGTFNRDRIDLTYHEQNVQLESEDFLMETDLIHSATFTYDLKEGKSYGKIPIRNGSYYDKKTGLLFTDIHADYEHHPKKIETRSIDAFCHGAYFSGSQEIDLSSPIKGEFDVNFHITTMRSKFSEAKKIFSHLNKPYFFLKIPMEADLLLRDEGAFINFHFEQDLCKIQSTIQGEMTNGMIASESFDVSVQDFNLNFDYNHEENDLVFTDIQGSLFVGKPERAEEYMIAGDHVRFTDYSKSQSQFDIWIGDKNRDIIRIAGKTKLHENDDSLDLVDIQLNQELTHFGHSQLKSFRCCLKDWSQIDDLSVLWSFNLESLLADLQRFSRTGFLFLSRSLLKELNDLKSAKGDFLVQVDFDKEKGLFDYTMNANDLEIASYAFKNAFFKGTKNGPVFSIHKLNLDKLSLAADLLHDENSLKINFLGLELGSSCMLGLEGEYDLLENQMIGHVNFLDAKIDQLKEFPIFKKWIDEYGIQGNLKGKGDLNLSLRNITNKYALDLLLNLSFSQIKMKDWTFKDNENISCHITSDKGVTLRGIKSALNENFSNIALFDIEKIEYGFKDQALSVEGVNFKLPAENIEIMTDGIASYFKTFKNETVLDLLKKCKKSGFLEGSLNLDISNPYYALRLSLKDGSYHLFDMDHEIQDFVLEYDPCEFKMMTKIQQEEIPFLVSLQTKSKSFEFGKIVIQEALSRLAEDEIRETPLTVYWRRNEDTGIVLEAMEGIFKGLNFALYRNPDLPIEKGLYHMTGEIVIDGRGLSSLVPKDYRDKYRKLKLGSGYALKGNFTFFDGIDYNLKGSKFEGELIGSDFEIKGYEYKSLVSHLKYGSNRLDVSDVLLKDPCGTVIVDKFSIYKEEDCWRFDLPLLRMEEVRPSLMKSLAMNSSPLKKPLVIDQLELEQFQGDLLNKESYTGFGRLFFKNPHKKNLQNTILAVPAEIISRIGLDLTALTPVIGTVEYQILHGKILLTKFRDVYSEGRLSKFYLADTGYPSYIDFDGNLFLKVKMKHYNLLFKLAEMFVVNVQGNLKKPTYSFQKQQKNEFEVLEPIAEAI